ncbi:hypothetical protein [Amycolatopsis sp. DG1A-15b]|uniref:hypothetical protein n=1 Tax=Amycolatopsis sp. DG1A-15b TaxID=3052846 RepID=UPI00255BAD7C|nr:hypothetical protein [Amycolatopsis sp. DG1A-15b]WIX85839.1 hypothetical protein QRY02_32135 [Amycolatopsis sp. DG1A-15b]
MKKRNTRAPKDRSIKLAAWVTGIISLISALLGSFVGASIAADSSLQLQLDQFKEQRLDESRKVRGEAYQKFLDAADGAERGTEEILECMLRLDLTRRTMKAECKKDIDATQEAVEVVYRSRDAIAVNGSGEAIKLSYEILYSVAEEDVKGFNFVRPYILDLEGDGPIDLPYYGLREKFQHQMCVEINPLPGPC